VSVSLSKAVGVLYSQMPSRNLCRQWTGSLSHAKLHIRCWHQFFVVVYRRARIFRFKYLKL